MNYTTIRSKRKTIGLQVKADGQVIVRAPLKMAEAEVQEFVIKHEDWIRKQLERIRKQQQEQPAAERLTMQEIQMLADQALKVIPERVAYYAPKVGVTYGSITIRNHKSRWGSCSAKGNLNFNCLLMLAPPEVVDSVVVHELCHRKEMNHSSRFYEEVLRVCPDYRKWDQWLKENGSQLLRRMTG